MICITAPNRVYARILLPSSKSISNRSLIINALSKNKSQLENLSGCDDTRVMVKALTSNDKIADVEGAGTAMRFLTAYFSITKGIHTITGSQRMKQRPVSILVDALRELGAQISYTETTGFPPLLIEGKKLTGDSLILKGNVSSQYVSALLMIAPLLEKGLTLRLTGEIVSRPYINLTLELMQLFGVTGEWLTENSIRIQPQTYKTIRYKVENDWSAASYWYEIAALSGSSQIELPGLSENSMQGDSRVAEIFKALGVETRLTTDGIQIRHSHTSTGKLELDLTGQPDLAQTLAVTCAVKNIPFRLCGLQSLRIKETDRIAALICELGKLGYIIKEKDGSTLYWDGERKEPLSDIRIETYEDHRMAMAFAPASLVLPQLKVNHPEVVSKSYPGFWEDLNSAGFTTKPSF